MLERLVREIPRPREWTDWRPFQGLEESTSFTCFILCAILFVVCIVSVCAMVENGGFIGKKHA